MSAQVPTSTTAKYGQLVNGPPASGKTTYCSGLNQFLTALARPHTLVNLDPAAEPPPYPASIDIRDLITVKDVMDEYSLGPNGAMLYCFEYLDANFDWLEDRLRALRPDEQGYVVFDLPGQVELSTGHRALANVLGKLGKLGYRLCAVHLTDAHAIADPSKYISALLLSLRTMLALELPHINVLSKIDLLNTYGELPFNLDFYTQVQDLHHLSDHLSSDPRLARFGKLNEAVCELVEDFGLVSFETLAVEDKQSMYRLLSAIDRALGYVFLPPPTPGSSAPPSAMDLFSTAMGALPEWAGGDVQERWVDAREEWDAWERERWKEEGEEVERRRVTEQGGRWRGSAPAGEGERT